ncbi:MAG: hypothetical protein ACYC2G_03070 [Gemmatimonadaceae bacterium]
MFRLILILVLGMAIGYGYGFRDARSHDKTIVARALDRVGKVGGEGRKYSSSDADAVMRRAER